MEKIAGFLLPVAGGQIYLGQRNTEPFKGWYGAIGGKADPARTWEAPHLIEKMGGHKVLSIADTFAMDNGQEFPMTTCIREGYEELFGRPPSIDEPTHPLRLGFTIDPEHEVVCYVTLATLATAVFTPNPRELAEVRRLADIPIDRIFPLTVWALTDLKGRLEMGTLPDAYREAVAGIPALPDLDGRFSSMTYAMWMRGEQRVRRGLPPAY